MLHLEHSVVWCCNLDTLESKSEMPLKFLNMLIEISWTDLLGRIKYYVESRLNGTYRL